MQLPKMEYRRNPKAAEGAGCIIMKYLENLLPRAVLAPLNKVITHAVHMTINASMYTPDTQVMSEVFMHRKADGPCWFSPRSLVPFRALLGS